MSSPEPADLTALRRRVLDVYGAITLLMLLGIAVLIGYALRLGSLAAPGAERSFGLAVALMAIMGAVVFDVADRTYRVWPLGRRFRPSPRPSLTTDSWVRLLKVLIVVAAAGAVAYLIGGLLA